MIRAHSGNHFTVREYRDGSRELQIVTHGRRHWFAAPADDSTLALLADQKISFRTLVQGRDFGHRTVSRGSAILWIMGSTALAGLVLWLAWRKKRGPAMV